MNKAQLLWVIVHRCDTVGHLVAVFRVNKKFYFDEKVILLSKTKRLCQIWIVLRVGGYLLFLLNPVTSVNSAKIVMLMKYDLGVWRRM